MKSFTRLVLLSLTALMVSACGNESVKLVPAGKEFKEDFTEKPTDFAVFNPKVDILFVIDDSASMDEAQRNLSRNAYLFADGMSKASILDYHIGIVTTDMEDYRRSGILYGTPKYFDRNTPDMVNKLSKAMMVGLNGSGLEKMFDPVNRALSAPLVTKENNGFYRPDAYLAVIFLTDADDQGFGSPEQFYDFLVALKQDASKVLAYGVIRTLATQYTTCTSSMESVKGYLERFLDLVVNADKNKSNVLSLCEPSYGVKLADFAKDIVKRSAGSVKLNRVPNVKTIVVTFGTQVIPNDLKKGWVYEPSTNSILLSEGIDWDLKQANAGLKVDFSVIETN